MFGLAKNKLENKMKKKCTGCSGKEIGALGILKEYPGTRLGFEPALRHDTLFLTLPPRGHTLVLLHAA